MQKFIKGMTLTLIMTFLATMIPSYNVVAKEKSTDSSVEVQQGTESDGLIVGEITEKREENVKHFMKDDGTFVAMMYNNPVHYKEGSEWKDIDNTLVEKEDAKGIVESKEDILKEATIFSDTSTSETTSKTIEVNDGNNSIEAVEEVKESVEEQVKSDESVSKEKEILAQNKEVKTDSKPTEKVAKDKEVNKSKNNKVLENKSNDFKISIAQNINADKLVSINKDKYEVSWNIKSDKNVKVNKKETTDEDVNKLLGLTKEQEKKLSKKEKAELENSKKATLIKTTSSVVFEEVKPNINLEYKLISDSIKESIIINKPTDINKFSFNFNMKNLKPELKDNQIILSDKDTGKEIMRMQAPFMVDAKGEQTDRVKLSFDKKGKGYILTLELDKEWINSKDRQYPIIVDPSFESSVRSSDIRDTFVASNDTEDKSTNMFLRVGNTPQIGATRTFIKFVNLPQLTMGDMIIDAKLYLLKIPTQSGTDGQIDVHKVTSDWNNVGLRWSNQPSIDWTIKDYQNYSSNNWQYWDITDIAKDWYTTGNNYGLCVKKNDERSGHSTYLSSDTSDSNGYPSVYFSYVNNSGLQSYWTYHSQSVGRAGTTNINDYNGNVIHVHDDVSMSGNRLPTVIKHVYNSNDRGTDIGFGPGWRLNLSQEITYRQIGSKGYYQYIDEDGTRRYFEYTGMEMKEEYGGELTLINNGNGTFTIKDKDNNSLLFNDRYLEEIMDANGNKIDLQYDNGKLKRVVDGVGRVTRIEYSIYGKLQEIYYPDNTKVRFDYSGDIMKWITYADGKQSIYDYNGQNNLTSVVNIDGYKMNYEYYSQSPNRIKKVTEGNTDGTVGSSMSYEYSFNSTKFTDNKGNVNYYQFDNSGKTISIRDAAGYAQAYQYGDGTNVNKMTLESKLQKTVNNFIDNGSAEDTTRNFAFASGGSGTGGGGFTSSVKYIGNNSLNVYKGDNVGCRYVDQNVWLQKGKTFTFSAYVKTANISNIMGKGAHLVVYYKDKTGTYIPVRSKFLTGNNEWTRLETTFTLPTDSTDNFVIARCELLEESGNAYYDALQLEEGSVANRYNLVENADMSGSSKIPEYWSDVMNGGATHSEASDTRLTIDDSNLPAYLDGHVFKLTGRQDKDTRIHQEIKISGKAGDSFVVSGWAKGAAVPHGTFAIQPVFISSSGNQWETISFNRDSKNWQYANGVIKAKSDFSEIHLYLTYSNNANEVMFDGIQVFKEEFGDTYQYDSKGNIISSVDLSKQQTKFEYNGSNDLIKATDPKGNQFKYEYDSKKNITKATSAENLIYNFEYDSYGNAIKSKISGTSLFIESSAKYTSNGNYISSVTDSLGNTVGYNYDETKGTLTSTTDAKGNVTNYKYDINNALSSVTKKVDGVDVSNSYTYKNDRIDTIGHNGFTYNFIYDTLGRTTGVNVGSQRLITNTYEANGGNLIESTYGNGAKVQTNYDNLDRVVAKKVNGAEIEHYSYDASGNLAILEDKVNNTTYKYNYDSSERLVNLTDSKGNSYKNEYDANNNVSKQINTVNGQKRETSYEFDKDNKITKFIFNNGTNFIQYTYDEIARNKEKTLNLGNNFAYKTTTQYLPGVNGSASTQVGTISNNGAEIKYTYDKNGNIETIIQNSKTTKYYYNELNELTREDNQALGKTTLYSYDAGGNITSKREYDYTTVTPGTVTDNVAYGYGDTNWKDKLTSYNGKNITYDAIGNPLTYDGSTFTWERGRTLTKIEGNNKNISCKYDGSGIRTEKNVDGIVSRYTLQGDKVVSEEITNERYEAVTDGSNVDRLNYTYDGTGNLVSMNISQPKNTLGGTDEIGILDPQLNSTASIVDVKNPKTQLIQKVIRLNGNAITPMATSKILNLKTNSKYVVEFDYWADSDNVKFDVDLYPDDLPQKYPVAKKELQHYRWEFTSSSNNMSNSYLRFFNDCYAVNPANIYITNIKLHEYSEVNIVGDNSDIGLLNPQLNSNASIIDAQVPQMQFSQKVIRLNGNTSSPMGISKILSLKSNSKYVVEFDYWADSDNIKFDVDLYPDDLPQKYPVAKKELQHYRWEFTSSSNSMSNAYLRFFNDCYSINPSNIYITNIKLYELDSNNQDDVSYYYVRNLQGDIIGLIDKTGTQVVTYNYDSWGKLISIEGSLKDSVGVKNPYRYRGYRYDNETGMYYLQSRYYNPEWGRFINADGLIGTQGDILSFNMFAYCRNNPINSSDPTGYRDIVDSGGGGSAYALALSFAGTAYVSRGIVLGTRYIGGIIADFYSRTHASYAESSSSGSQNKDTSSSSSQSKTQSDGIVYKRTDKETGENYIGQAKSPERYKARQKEHSRANPEADFDFEVVGRAKPGIDLDILEQRKINELGGLKRKGGELQNGRNQIREQRWDNFGIKK